jgi:hypothetical protein
MLPGVVGNPTVASIVIVPVHTLIRPQPLNIQDNCRVCETLHTFHLLFCRVSLTTLENCREMSAV